MRDIDIEEILKDADSAGDLLAALCNRSECICKLDIKLEKDQFEQKIKDSATLKRIKDLTYFKALCITIDKIHEIKPDKASTLLKDILVAKNDDLEKFYQMMGYFFLISIFIDFIPQVHISSNDCYKKDDHDTDADGVIKEWKCVFDIKRFGIVFPHIVTAQRKLQQMVDEKLTKRIDLYKSECTKKIKTLSKKLNGEVEEREKNKLEEKLKLENKKLERIIEEEKSNLWNYSLIIGGKRSLSLLDIKKQIMEKLDEIVDGLIEDAWNERMKSWEDLSNWESETGIKKHGLGYIERKIDGTLLVCELHSPISKGLKHGLLTSYNEIDLYEWAMNNRFYFMHDASQFVRNRPYMILCAFDKDKDESGGFLNFSDSLHGYFRELCRRIFIDLNRITDRNVDDERSIPVTISEASKKITGIIFIETSAIAKGELSDAVWVYLNPNADNPLLNYQIHQFHVIQASITDYRFDNY